MEYFRNNLIDIGEDITKYGTHSFRRGGCQYLASERRWDIRKLCDWGDGAWTLTISPLSDILLVGMINLYILERTSWTRRNRLGRSVLTVEGPVIVHDIN